MTKTIKKPDLNINALDREARLLRSQLSDMKCLFDQNKDEEHKKLAAKKIAQIEELITAIDAYKKMVATNSQKVKG